MLWEGTNVELALESRLVNSNAPNLPQPSNGRFPESL